MRKLLFLLLFLLLLSGGSFADNIIIIKQPVPLAGAVCTVTSEACTDTTNDDYWYVLDLSGGSYDVNTVMQEMDYSTSDPICKIDGIYSYIRSGAGAGPCTLTVEVHDYNNSTEVIGDKLGDTSNGVSVSDVQGDADTPANPVEVDWDGLTKPAPTGDYILIFISSCIDQRHGIRSKTSSTCYSTSAYDMMVNGNDFYADDVIFQVYTDQ